MFGRRIIQCAVVAGTVAAGLSVLAAGQASAQTEIRPGFNLFSVEQDQEIGRESAVEVERQLPIIRDRTVDTFIDTLGKRLAAVAPGAKYAYTFQVVDAPEINAFALPGGPIYLNRGLIEAATSEGQVAGILAHEIAHIALRHGTNQASKAYLGQSGLGLLGGLLGREDQSTQRTVNAIGGFGMNTLFLKFSRADERQADIVGAQILARSGHDPMAMVEFFDMLDHTDDHSPSKVEAFFSSHPPPGARADRVRTEMNSLKVARTAEVGGFDKVKARLLAMPSASGARQVAHVPHGTTDPDHVMVGDASASNKTIAAPASSYTTFEQRNRSYQIEYPNNWKVHEAVNGYGVTIAPEGGLVDTGRPQRDLIHGVVINHYAPFEADARDRFGPIQTTSGQALRSGTSTSFVGTAGTRTESHQLSRATEELIRQLQRLNPSLEVVSGAQRDTTIEGQPAESFVLSGPSRVTRREERVTLFTRALADDHLIYAVFVSPAQDYEQMRGTFSRMMSSLRVGTADLHH